MLNEHSGAAAEDVDIPSEEEALEALISEFFALQESCESLLSEDEPAQEEVTDNLCVCAKLLAQCAKYPNNEGFQGFNVQLNVWNTALGQKLRAPSDSGDEEDSSIADSALHEDLGNEEWQAIYTAIEERDLTKLRGAIAQVHEKFPTTVEESNVIALQVFAQAYDLPDNFDDESPELRKAIFGVLNQLADLCTTTYRDDKNGFVTGLDNLHKAIGKLNRYLTNENKTKPITVMTFRMAWQIHIKCLTKFPEVVPADLSQAREGFKGKGKGKQVASRVTELTKLSRKDSALVENVSAEIGREQFTALLQLINEIAEKREQKHLNHNELRERYHDAVVGLFKTIFSDNHKELFFVIWNRYTEVSGVQREFLTGLKKDSELQTLSLEGCCEQQALVLKKLEEYTRLCIIKKNNADVLYRQLDVYHNGLLTLMLVLQEQPQQDVMVIEDPQDEFQTIQAALQNLYDTDSSNVYGFIEHVQNLDVLIAQSQSLENRDEMNGVRQMAAHHIQMLIDEKNRLRITALKIQIESLETLSELFLYFDETCLGWVNYRDASQGVFRDSVWGFIDWYKSIYQHFFGQGVEVSSAPIPKEDLKKLLDVFESMSQRSIDKLNDAIVTCREVMAPFVLHRSVLPDWTPLPQQQFIEDFANKLYEQVCQQCELNARMLANDEDASRFDMLVHPAVRLDYAETRKYIEDLLSDNLKILLDRTPENQEALLEERLEFLGCCHLVVRYGYDFERYIKPVFEQVLQDMNSELGMRVNARDVLKYHVFECADISDATAEKLESLKGEFEKLEHSKLCLELPSKRRKREYDAVNGASAGANGLQMNGDGSLTKRSLLADERRGCRS